MQLVDLWETGVLFDEKGEFFQKMPISSERKMERPWMRDWSIDEGKEEIRDASKENPYSGRDITLLEYGCKFVKIGYFSKSGLKRWVLSKDCCNSHSLILAS